MHMNGGSREILCIYYVSPLFHLKYKGKYMRDDVHGLYSPSWLLIGSMEKKRNWIISFKLGKCTSSSIRNDAFTFEFDLPFGW